MTSSPALKDAKRAKGVNATLATGFVNTSYDCKRKTPLHGPNDELVGLLETIEHHRYLHYDEKRAFTYRKAIAALKAYPRKVESVGEASSIVGIGPKISCMIEEYLVKGTISQVQQILGDVDTVVLDGFTKIYGVGPKNAVRLMKQGFQSIAELREGVKRGEVKLTKMQVAGLKYYDDLVQTVPRESVKRIANQLWDFLTEEHEGGRLPKCQLEIVGGYRRGKEFSGDVDLLVSPTEQEETDNILSTVVESFQRLGRIIDVLNYGEGRARRSSTRLQKDPSTVDRSDKCLCIYQEALGTPHRRVDIIVVPRSQFPFALLGWAGSRQFERSLRTFAQREKHMQLSSHALIDRDGKCIEATTEEDIFKALDLEYIAPEYRNC